MSKHEALIEKVAEYLSETDVPILVGEYSDRAQDIIAIIAKETLTATEEMIEAGDDAVTWEIYDHNHGAWSVRYCEGESSKKSWVAMHHASALWPNGAQS